MTDETKIYTSKPKRLAESIQVSACYLEIDRQVLLLQSGPDRLEPGKWGVPAGKLEKGETPEEAAKRELFEETGISVPISQMRSTGPLYICKPHISYVYHLFGVLLAQKPPVQISHEHVDYIWASEQDLATLPLMSGALLALELYRTAAAQGKIYSERGLI